KARVYGAADVAGASLRNESVRSASRAERRSRGERSRRYARLRTELVKNAGEGLFGALGPAREVRGTKCDARRQRASDREAGIDAIEIHRTTNEEAAADQQRERDRDLRDDEDCSNAVASTGDRRPSTITKRLLNVRARGAPRGHCAEEHAA